MNIMPSAFGFAPETINSPDTINAYVVAWHEPGALKSHITKHRVAAYSVVYAGQGQEGALWGCSYARHQPPLLAQGVLHVLREMPRGVHLQVHAIKLLEDFVGRDGYIWRRSDIKGAKPMLDVAKRLKAGQWSFVEADEASQKSAPFASASRILKVTALPDGRDHHWKSPPASTARVYDVFLTGSQ